jgi:hypothetical protein
MLIDRQHDSDFEPARRGHGLIVLQDGRPGNVVRVQDVLELVIVGCLASPPVKLSESNQIYPVLLDIGQKPNESRAFFVCLVSRETFV